MFKPFSLANSINNRQSMELNELKINSIKAGMQKQRNIQSLAQMSNVPTFGDRNAPTQVEGDADFPMRELPTGQRYDAQTNVENLQAEGYADEAAKLSEQIGKMNEVQRKDLTYKNTEISKLLVGVNDEATYNERQEIALSRGLINQEQMKPYSPESVQQQINTGRKIEDILNPGKQDRGGYTTLVDVLLTNEDGTTSTYKVPFDHRSGTYKWGEKILQSPKTVSNQAALAGGKKGAQIEAKERTEAKIDMPKVRSEARQLINVVEKVIDHPGFSSVVGAPSVGKVLQYVGGTDAAGFKVLFDQLGGKQFLQAYETLKGGGQITEIEGEKATDAMSTMNTAVSEKEFKKAAKTFISEINKMVKIAEQRSSGKKSASKDGWSIREIK